jgi:hypothetical protein
MYTLKTTKGRAKMVLDLKNVVIGDITYTPVLVNGKFMIEKLENGVKSLHDLFDIAPEILSSKKPCISEFAWEIKGE